MNLAELQAELRYFAAERDWQPFHTPKNLSTALMVEAGELAEIFQWMTPEASQAAHRDATSKQRIGEDVADVLLYLVQLADHSQIDIAQAVRDKLVRNAKKYPATQTIARVSHVRASVPGTHILLDYENVQPTEDELRALVPDAGQIWVFHGPHQRQIEQRFASFGADVTAVPISKTGKNALDFHLSFYMGYIASRNPAAEIVVVANDKGYGPMLEHAKAMGFAVRQQGHGRVKAGEPGKATPTKKVSVAAKPAAKKVAAKGVPAKKAKPKPSADKQVSAKNATAKKAPARVPVTKKAPAKKTAPAEKAMVKPASTPAAKKILVTRPANGAAIPFPLPAPLPPASAPSLSAALIEKITVNLRKMADKRPVKAASLRRALKSFLGAEPGDDSIETALGELIAAGVVAVGSRSDVSYPAFAIPAGSDSAKA